MPEIHKILTDAGYKVFGNKNLSKDPIIAVNTKWLDNAEKCDRDQILESIINFCKHGLSKEK